MGVMTERAILYTADVVLYEHSVRRMIGGQLLVSEALSAEMEIILNRNTNNVNYMTPKPVGLRYCASFCEAILYLGEFENREKRLSASSCLSVCLSLLLHGTIRHLLNEFSLNLTFTYFSKICRENSAFIKISKE
jgi:hypothetical protein